MVRAGTAAVMLALACGGGAVSPSSPPAAVVEDTVAADACPPAYAEYEQRWRVALIEDLTAVSASLEPDVIEEIVASQVAELPNRDELMKLRAVYSIVALFIFDAAWPVAFEAADRAIEDCGERASRPH